MEIQDDWLADIHIRLAQELDLNDMEWDGEYIYYRRLFKQIFEGMNTGESHIWVAILDRVGLVGQMFVQFSSNRYELADGRERGYIYGFRVKPAFRRRGLGSKMLEYAEDDLRMRNYQWATLNVSKQNLEGQKFYQRHGFQIVANESGNWSYFDHEGVLRKVHDPAFRMEKRIK
jgi:ribosomal protein S18 acetylase RimI-like enzyme